MSKGSVIQAADLATCEREPIHIPGSIQPHGVLLVCDGEPLRIRQVSGNIATAFGAGPEAFLDQEVARVLDGRLSDFACQLTEKHSGRPPGKRSALIWEDRGFRQAGYQTGRSVVIELEPAPEEDISFIELAPTLGAFLAGLQESSSLEESGSIAAKSVRQITGYDRVLIYRFDKDWHGNVIAEDRNDVLPSYLGLRFPASDIPAQARELYRLNRIRLIADANYKPVPIVPRLHPDTGEPLDMSGSMLRSVSPVHLEYMRNMGTAASMSVSIVSNGQLWGLISCHNEDPRYVSFEMRMACDMIGRVLSLHVAEKERQDYLNCRILSKSVEARLLAYMSEADDFTDALAGHSVELMELVGAQGVAVVRNESCVVRGNTPDVESVRNLTAWIADQGDEIFHTHELSQIWPGGAKVSAAASGALAISISKLHPSYVIWFRPEVIQTVNWGGDPRKPVEVVGQQERISPRRSFELWKEVVRGQAIPWLPYDIDAATDLRNAIVGIVLRQAEELAEVSGELERSNKELEAFSYSVSHDLRAPFRHIVGYAELLRETLANTEDPAVKRYIDTVIDSAHYAGKLVDNLLSFSQIGRTALQKAQVNMFDLVMAVLKDLRNEISGRSIDWQIAKLPAVWADPVLLRLTWQNLISNAVKYTKAKEYARIRISHEIADGFHVFSIADNGVGFEMKYVGKLFGVFQRLHRMEEFEGTGIGLANVRRIVARHGGQTWAEGEINQGATFHFSLPVQGGYGAK